MIPATCKTCGREFERPDFAAGLDEKWRARLELWEFDCPECVEAADARQRWEAEEEEARQHAERVDRRRSASGIPVRLRGLKWSDIALDERSNAIAAAGEWPFGRSRGLLLAGSVGVGKTRIAATAAWQYLGVGSLRWLSAPLLFARLGSGFGSQQRDDALEVLTGSAALVLDDLDKVRPTEYAAEHVFLAIDGRITEGVPLLVTTNLTLDALADKFPEPYGPSIVSRLVEYCDAFLLEGADRRLEVAA